MLLHTAIQEIKFKFIIQDARAYPLCNFIAQLE